MIRIKIKMVVVTEWMDQLTLALGSKMHNKDHFPSYLPFVWDRIVRHFLSPKCSMWVVLTCVSRCLTQCKRNQLNPTILPGENVQNVVGFCSFGQVWKYPDISARFGRFLKDGCLDWADSFCIASGISRHKFRPPTGHFGVTNFPTILPLYPSWGNPKKNDFCEKNTSPMDLIT
jgi:hypothetical protein